MARSKKSVDEVLKAVLAAVDPFIHSQSPHATAKQGPWLVAWSGGLDSTVLVHTLIGLVGAKQVRALHVQHGLQPQAESWAQHCVAQARAWGVGLEVARIPESPPPGQNVEQWARQWRYDLLRAAAQRLGARAVLTAHHADDQLETVLLAMGRGCGLDGLTGIAPWDVRDGMVLIRPFLQLDRSVLVAQAHRISCSWVHDPSNDVLSLRRNRVRAQVLPTLKSALPGISAQLFETLELLREARHTLEDLAAQDWQLARPLNPLGFAGYTLNRQAVAVLPRSRQAALVRAWLRAWQVSLPARARLEVWLDQLVVGSNHYAEQRLDSLHVVRYRDTLWLIPHAVTQNVATHVWLPARQPVCVLPGAGSLVWVEGDEGFNPEWLGQQTLEVVAPPSQALLRLHHDRPSRTIKNLNQEWAIPRALRESFPAVQCAGALLWAAPFGMSHDARWPRARPGLQLAWRVDDLRALCGVCFSDSSTL
jgi:tRNA(Ile)-lysidine synthase